MPRRQARVRTRALQQRAARHRSLAREMLGEGEILIVSGRTVRGEFECYVHHATAAYLARIGEAVWCDQFGDPLRSGWKVRCIKSKETS